jgi:hypothetical protein
LLNDCYRGDAPPRLSDRFALLASYLGNGALATARAAREGGDQRRYAWGYLRGALRGTIESPSAERLTPRIDWAGEARRSMAAARPAES